MRATAGFFPTNVVDLYNGATGAWSTAQLSVACYYNAAASAGNVALFAGGQTLCALLCKEGEGGGLVLVACLLSVLQYDGSECLAMVSSLMQAL